VKILDNAITRAENGNLILRKFNHFRPHKDNLDIGLCDMDQELLDKLKIPDFMEKEKSKSPISPPNPSGSSTNYKKPTVEIPPIDIDRSLHQDISKRTQPGPSTTSNKPNTRSHTKNFNKFNFRSLSPVNSSASENADSDKDSVVSDHFHTSSGTIVQPPREWWKIDPSNDIQMKDFKRLTEVNPSIAESKANDKITLLSRLDEAGLFVDVAKEEEPKVIGKRLMGQTGNSRRKQWIRNWIV
jgi:hypothetical protein